MPVEVQIVCVVQRMIFFKVVDVLLLSPLGEEQEQIPYFQQDKAFLCTGFEFHYIGKNITISCESN